MKRFIRYLYEYEQDKRLRNVGFVKAEQGDRECVLHIHGKGLDLQEEKSLRVYLFFTEEGACFGIWQGDAQNVNPAINYRLYYTDQDVGGKEQFARIGGVILEAAGGRKFAAVWDDEAVNIGGMRVYTEERREYTEERREQEISAGEEADEQEISAGEEADEQEIPAGEEADAQEQDMEAADQDRPGGFLCTKIQRKDLARLPRCEWKLSNNSPGISGRRGMAPGGSAGNLPSKGAEGGGSLRVFGIHPAKRHCSGVGKRRAGRRRRIRILVPVCQEAEAGNLV